MSRHLVPDIKKIGRFKLMGADARVPDEDVTVADVAVVVFFDAGRNEHQRDASQSN